MQMDSLKSTPPAQVEGIGPSSIRVEFDFELTMS